MGAPKAELGVSKGLRGSGVVELKGALRGLARDLGKAEEAPRGSDELCGTSEEVWEHREGSEVAREL